MTPEQILNLQKLGLGVLEAVSAGGDLGAPGGTLYAAMMQKGASLQQFQSFMGTLTGRGMLTQMGDCYYITDAGKNFKTVLEAKFGQPHPA
jgi:hypothetical protein